MNCETPGVFLFMLCTPLFGILFCLLVPTSRLTSTLASTTLKSAPNERHFFAIYISYYVKVRLVVSGVGGDVSAKLPFVLMRDGPEILSVDAENACEDAIHSHSPERQASPVPFSDNASSINDISNTKCLVEHVAESHETGPISAELHTEPKLLISDQENPLNEIQELPLHAHSNSQNEKVEPVESDGKL